MSYGLLCIRYLLKHSSIIAGLTYSSSLERSKALGNHSTIQIVLPMIEGAMKNRSEVKIKTRTSKSSVKIGGFSTKCLVWKSKVTMIVESIKWSLYKHAVTCCRTSLN